MPEAIRHCEGRLHELKIGLEALSRSKIPSELHPFEKEGVGFKQQEQLTKSPWNINDLYYLEGVLKSSKGTVDVGFLDTGISELFYNQHQENIVETVDFTDDEEFFDESSGHGTFMVGLLLNKNEECPGVNAPGVHVHIFKIFNKKQRIPFFNHEINLKRPKSIEFSVHSSIETYISWLISALDAILASGIDLLNISVGGLEIREPIVNEKLQKLVQNNVTVVVSSGNTGPYFG